MSEVQVRQMLLRECCVSGIGGTRVTLCRFEIARSDDEASFTSPGERLYFLLDAHGSLSVRAAGACWKYQLAPNMVVWMPQALEHAFHSVGDAPLRGIMFEATLDALTPTSAVRQDTPPIVAHLYEFPQRSMVTFLTRTVFRNAHPERGVLSLSEVQTVLPGGHVPLHTHEARIEMCYVLCGSGILTRQDEMQAVCAGEAVLIPSNVAHSMANENEEVLEYGIAQFVDDEGSSPGPAMRKEGRP